MRTKFCVLILLLAVSLKSNAQDGDNSGIDSFAKIDSLLAEVVKKDMVGLTICKIKNDEIIWQGNYGWANLEEKIPVSSNSIFTVASVSKTITGTALMQLYEKGRFKLDDNINDYIPVEVVNPNYPDIPITFRMLLTHSSTLLDERKLMDSLYNYSDKSFIPLEKLIKYAFNKDGKYYSEKNFSTYKPGEKFIYGNLNFVFIAYLVERLSDKSFVEYCKENIFEPLEMNETSFFQKDIDPSLVAYCYVNHKFFKSQKVRINYYGWSGYAAGDLKTSAAEYANFIKMMLNNGTFNDKQILSPSTISEMFTFQNVDFSEATGRSLPVAGVGLVWRYFKNDSRDFFFHAGGGAGINSLALIDPVTKSGAFVVCTGTITAEATNVIMRALLK